MTDPLLELAEVRSDRLTIAGQPVIVREPSALENLEYMSRRVKDQVDGIAYLLSCCVVKEDGTPRWTLEQAQVVARGRVEVFTPLILAITAFISREKKVSQPSSDSTTA